MNTRSRLVTLPAVLLLAVSLLMNSGFMFRSLERFTLSGARTSFSGDIFPFTDVQGHWAEASIMEMYAKDVMKGYSDSTFRPKKPVTYLEAIVMMDRMLWGKPDRTYFESNEYLHEQFGIPEWAVGYIASAMINQLLDWNQLQKVALQQPLTRQDGAALAVRALELSKEAKLRRDVTLPFNDVSALDELTRANISIVYEKRIMTGFPNNNFQPTGPISRAEMAVILSRIAVDLPFVNSEEASGFLRSYDSLSNVITLVYGDRQQTGFKLPADFLVYLDGKSSAIGLLSPGNHVRIIDDGSSKLAVLIAQSVVPDTGVPAAAEKVNLAAESAEVQQWVETNKASEAYLTAVFKGYLYILAARGEKMTGGYTVDITKISSTTDPSGTHYRAWIERTDPGRYAIVTPAITYPLAVMRVKLPEKAAGTVTFVDKLNQVMAETKYEVKLPEPGKN